MSRHRPSTWVSIALVSACTSCGSDESAPSPAPPDVDDAALAALARDARPKLLFERIPPALEEWNADNYRRVDPALDGWPLEALHDAVRPRLEELVRRLWQPEVEGPRFEGLLAADFAGASTLRPEGLEPVFDDGNTRVLRAASIPDELRSPRLLEELAAALRAPFAGASVTPSVAVERIEEQPGQLVLEVRLHVGARSGRGALQQNTTWRTSWSQATPGAAPELRSLVALAFEEISSRSSSFADHSARWLGPQEWLERDFLHGLEDFYFRQDRLTGNPLLGEQGLAVGDLDGDGLDDVYVCMQGGLPNRLLLHTPTGGVRDGTNAARVGLLDNTRAALIVDLDGDGARDIAAAVGPHVWIAFNDGQCVFRDQMLLHGPGEGDVFSIVAGDPDGDGDLDLYCCRYVKGGMIAGVPLPYFDANNGESNIYWRNLGQRRFENATADAGFDSSNGKYSMAAMWEDLDDDGDLDLYVANDFGRNNLFQNDGSAHFRDVATECGAEDLAAGMGVTSADFDRDGTLDLYVSNMYSAVGLRVARQSERFMGGEHSELHTHLVRHARGNTLLRGLGGGRYEDVTERLGCARAGWAWGAMFLDLDADGYEDLLVPNGFITNHGGYDVESFFWRRVVGQTPPDTTPSESYRHGWASMQHMVMNDAASYNGAERDTAFLNLGGTSFADVSTCVGFDFPDDSRAIGIVDWDDDGRPDVVLKNRTAPRLRFLRNQDASGNHFVAVELRGRSCNRDAFGARVRVEAGGRVSTKVLHAGEGYLAQSSRRMHFGLGRAERITRLDVRWPDGTTSEFSDLAADTRYGIVQGEAAPVIIPSRSVRVFEDAEPRALIASSTPIARFALVEKIPLAELAFSTFDRGSVKVKDFAGAPLSITLWSAGAQGSAEQLRDLALRAADLHAAGLRTLVLTTDEGPDLVGARRLVAELGLQASSGFVDGHARKALEVLFIEVLGRSKEVPQPSSLLVDEAGQWMFGYLGPVAIDTLLADTASLATVDPANLRAAKLLGGRWVLRRTRDWDTLSAVFRELGDAAAADLLAAWGAREDEDR